MPDSLSPSSLHIRWCPLLPGCLGGRHTPSCPSALLFISGLSRSSLVNNTVPPLKMKIKKNNKIKKKSGCGGAPEDRSNSLYNEQPQIKSECPSCAQLRIFYAINKKSLPITSKRSWRPLACRSVFFPPDVAGGMRGWEINEINSESTHESSI